MTSANSSGGLVLITLCTVLIKVPQPSLTNTKTTLAVGKSFSSG